MAKRGEPLTERELQVMRGIAAGKRNAAIGKEMFVSEDRIKSYAREIFIKLGARNRTDAAAIWLLRSVGASGSAGSSGTSVDLPLADLLAALPSAAKQGIPTIMSVYRDLKRHQLPDSDEVTAIPRILIERAGPYGMLVRIFCLQLEELKLLERKRDTRRLFLVGPPTLEAALQAHYESLNGAAAEAYRLLVLAFLVGPGESLVAISGVYKGFVARD